jgi:hypothetical protein
MFTAELLLFVGTRRRERLDGSRDASLSPNESIKSEKFGLEEFPGRCARCSFRVLSELFMGFVCSWFSYWFLM